MFAVGRLGSYISRGVSRVSSPFPLGGAVDVIVVEQQDGTFKSTPWYVRFGKYQGNLTENIVTINVNGVDVEFYMYLDHKGEAFFVREVDGVEGESDVYVSSGDEMDLKSDKWRTQKSMSCNFDANREIRDSELGGSPRKSLSRANSRRGKIFGLPIGRRSMKENGVQDAQAEAQAEMAADLLEVRWSTNLRTGQNPNLRACKGQNLVGELCDEVPINGRNETQGEVSTSPKCRKGEEFLNVVPEKDKIDGVLTSDDSKEEQFEFSDIDDSKEERGKHSKSLSTGSLDFPSPSGSSDDGDGEPKSRSDPNRVSTPIGISKGHSDADVAGVGPVAESLPNMVFDGDDLSVNGTQTYGRSLDSTLEAFKRVDDGNTRGGAEKEVVNSHVSNDSSEILEEIRKIISDPAIEVSLCRHSLFEGMGYEAASRAFDANKLDKDKFLSFGRDILENNKLVVRIGGLYFPWDAALPIASAIGSQGHVQNLEPKGMIAVGEFEEGISEPRSMNSESGSWRMWPFSLKRTIKRTNSMRSRSFSSEIHNPSVKENTRVIDKVISKVLKKKLREKFPTSEQLGSLNLKEGKNTVIFTFTTAMYGEQQVEARIFLWKWNSRIVISDVDGTITKSDVLGQFMPLMGYDWSQTGVTHLFSAIKENGYELLFLSARSISQAYLTRQFLINLKQDGKALPEGPVLISPDGLFPSLYREVIRRAPHEFKIACLEDVKVLFPVDHNPFYAGFGNRDTDELSYLKVGIPRGKIFTINPKGEVVVNRRVDTKSYTSLHALVHDMFPPTTMHEQEDYNQWNFWRLPPPDPII